MKAKCISLNAQIAYNWDEYVTVGEDYELLKIDDDDTILISTPVGNLWADAACFKFMGKKSWNREEVINLLKQFNNDKPGIYDCTEWIEQNL